MEKFLNSKGSEWNKWDLHIHSPATILNNNFKNDWDAYIEELEKMKGFVALGITDYYDTDGYFRVKKEKEMGRLPNIDLILPNIELRLNLPTVDSRAINYHIIFSPEVDQYINQYFLNELEFNHGGRVYKCNKQDLIDLGKHFSAKDSDESKLIAGTLQFKVSIENIKYVLEKHSDRFKDKYLLVVPNGSNDGLSGLRQSSFKGIKENIYQSSHAIFSSSKNDRDFFLGISKGEKVVIDQCGKLMPCIHGSDAHELDKIGKPDGNRFTWIKANPTFEGLYQIIFEPKDRVVIQEDRPYEKLDYNVIEKVQFKKDSDFQEREIFLNPGLNTIIGGKSSGKSLLLYKIAMAISREEVNLREKDKICKNAYKDTFIEDAGFRVFWRNGQISESHLDKQVGLITYIPQMYINALSEESGNEVLQNKIIDILSEDPGIEKQIHENEKIIKNHEKNIHSLSYELNSVIDKKSKYEHETKEKVDIELLKEQKVIFEKELEILLNDSQLSTEDENLMNDIYIVIENNKADERRMEKEVKDLDLYNEKLIEVGIQLSSLNEEFQNINKPHLSEISISFEKDINKAVESAVSKVENAKSINSFNIEKSKTIVNDLEKYLKVFEDNINNQTKINQIRAQIKQEEGKIRYIDEIIIKIEELKTLLNKHKRKLIDDLKKVFELQLEFVSKLNKISNLEDIEIEAKIIFNQERFETGFLNYFNLRKNLLRIIKVETIDENKKFVYNDSDYISNVEYLLDVVLELPKENFKKGSSLSDVIANLVKVYTETIIEVKKDNDLISEMSPGKRGLVLLELFLSIANETHPILIDQPEDNLDNRTISTELVNFIRDKSKERQIILVTHNANLVVLTDSDNVIVANQDVQLIENDLSRFEYINGSLECDFDNESEKLSSKGIKSHTCEILEGGPDAFTMRERKYRL